MPEDHVYDRYNKAKIDTDSAEDEVKRLVSKVADIATRLQNWKKLGFTGSLSDGSPIHTPGAAIVVDINAMPPLEEIYRAVQKWRDCCTVTQGAIAAMDQDQRRTLGLA